MTTLPIFGSSLERQQWVIATLRVRGSSVAELARENGIARTALDAAFYRPADRAEKILAEAVGASQQQLFPERYNAEGHRLFRVRRRIDQSAAA